MGHAQTRKVDFTQDAVDQPPKGFEFGHTAGVGKARPMDRSGRRHQSGPRAGGSRLDTVSIPGCGVVRCERCRRGSVGPVQADLGTSRSGGGLVWRYQNQDNYYIVRANALEDNVVLYKVRGRQAHRPPVKGEGRTYGKKSEVPAGQWSTLRVVANGRLFEVYFNGTKLYEVDDATFSKPGKVGVWTKADSITQFDDLTVVTK